MAGLKRAPSMSSSSEKDLQWEPSSRQMPTVYDAVAGKKKHACHCMTTTTDAFQGRVTQNGLLGPKHSEQRRANQRLRPDEVLFKKNNAPTRFEETDYYYAHRNLPPHQSLPSGELLTAIHAYVSKLYSRMQDDGAEKIWRSMDETALIAFGILMEESVKEVIGDSGDLALTEAARSDEENATWNEDIPETRGSSPIGSSVSGNGETSSNSSASDSDPDSSEDESVNSSTV